MNTNNNLKNEKLAQALEPTQNSADLAAAQAAEEAKQKQLQEKLAKLEAEKNALEAQEKQTASFISELNLSSEVLDHIVSEEKSNYDLEMVNKMRSDISNEGQQAFYNWLLRSQTVLASKKKALQVDLTNMTGKNRDPLVKQASLSMENLIPFGGDNFVPYIKFEGKWNFDDQNVGYSVTQQQIDELIEQRLSNSLGKQSPINGKVFDIRDLITPNVLGAIKNAGIENTHLNFEALLTLLYNGFKSRIVPGSNPEGLTDAPLNTAWVYTFSDLNDSLRREALEKVADPDYKAWTYVLQNSNLDDAWAEMFRAYLIVNSNTSQTRDPIGFTSLDMIRLKFMHPALQKTFYPQGPLVCKVSSRPTGTFVDFSDRAVMGVDADTFLYHYQPNRNVTEGLTTRIIFDNVDQYNKGRFANYATLFRHDHFEKTLLFESTEDKAWFDENIRDYLRGTYGDSLIGYTEIPQLLLNTKSITIPGETDEDEDRTITWTIVDTETLVEISEDLRSIAPDYTNMKVNIQDYHAALTIVAMLNQYYAPDDTKKYSHFGYQTKARQSRLGFIPSGLYSRIALSLGLTKYTNDECVPYGSETIIRNKIANYAKYVFGSSLNYVTKYFGSLPVLKEFGSDFITTWINPLLIARYKHEDMIKYIPFIHIPPRNNGVPDIVNMSHTLATDGYSGTVAYNEAYSQGKFIFCEYIPSVLYWRYDYFEGQEEQIDGAIIDAGNDDEDVRFSDVDAKFVNVSSDVGYIDIRLSPNGKFEHKRICTMNISSLNTVFCLSLPKYFVNTDYVDGGRLISLHFSDEDQGDVDYDELHYYSPFKKVKRLIDRGNRTESLKKALFN